MMKFFGDEFLESPRPPIWSPYYYVNNLVRKAYESTIQRWVDLEANKRYRVLDFGCGEKPYKYILDNHIEEYVGVDVKETGSTDVVIEYDSSLPFPDGDFDIVISSQVLEHVEDVDLYLQECYRVLRQNGIFFLSTHGTWQYHSSPVDVQRWTSYGLRRLLQKHRFRIVDFVPILGQLALTSQLRLSFINSFSKLLGLSGRVLLIPISILYQLKIMVEDYLTPKRVKERDSAIYLVVSKKL